MKDEDVNFFPQFIDSPPIVGIFEMDEFMIFFGGVAFTILISIAFPQLTAGIVMLIAIFTGIALTMSYTNFKKKRPNGQTWHFLYKKGIYHPTDKKTVFLKYPYLKKITTIPYGFTKIFYN